MVVEHGTAFRPFAQFVGLPRVAQHHVPPPGREVEALAEKLQIPVQDQQDLQLFVKMGRAVIQRVEKHPQAVHLLVVQYIQFAVHPVFHSSIPFVNSIPHFGGKFHWNVPDGLAGGTRFPALKPNNGPPHRAAARWGAHSQLSGKVAVKGISRVQSLEALEARCPRISLQVRVSTPWTSPERP